MTIAQLFGHDDSVVDEANFETVFGGLHEGVFSDIDNECAVVESAIPAMTVEVQTGTFITGGVFAQVSAQEVLVVTVADAVNPRIDRVICRRNNATDTVTVVMLDGVAAGAPTPPALTRAGDIYEISLAQVFVAALAVVINTADITDERFNVAVCGFCSGNRAARVTVLDKDGTQVEVVSNAAETSLWSFEMPRGVLGATGGFKIDMRGDMLKNFAANPIVRVKLGATTILQIDLIGIANVGTRYAWDMTVLILNTAANAQKGNGRIIGVSGNGGQIVAVVAFLGVDIGAGAEDTADELTLDVTIEWGVANASLSCRKEIVVLELIPA